ncbi:2-amino-4-hydroxy-6-hydroxymethyldihydropteridine pyrophosphokinase [Marinobacterium nitratireducens]|uniref:2-amino-4-hydroxy-6-hydroxymethyldihydropteridine pyrophosphokinase n=1 Tax=Marinobacterium nitratireducens TaxID=518897 RepID=A0A917ZQQ7_9GAMM|nr:2-amino-4-hydroxy-6-hydroxymethyldihydropteridine diphosphokinase [Marinobacterium nitratireducens]GGO88584.1 2-amino-4-hydroxy-6-hydroxymethyldihydropteridine pyrophosphokinase [Marinobacterium nitratireducens]
MTEAIRCYIGLGSNLGDPRAQVERALQELAGLPRTVRVCHSSLYRSDPVGPPGQPDYVNAVACLDTRLEAHALLDELQALERLHQRVRLERWGPRTLDLDLLLYGDQSIDSERLQVPHPYLTERGFVLWPLAEIAPRLQLPDGRALPKLLERCPMGTLERMPV